MQRITFFSKAVEANGITENMTLDVAYMTNLFSKELHIDMTDFVKSAENLTQYKWHMNFLETESNFFSPTKHALLINYLIGMQMLRWKQDETSKTFLFKLDQNAPLNIIFILKTIEYFPKDVSQLPAFGQSWFENLEAPEWIKLALPKCEVTSTLDVKMLAKKLDIPFQEVASEDSSKLAYFQISAKGIGIPSDTVLQPEQDRFRNAKKIYIQGPYLAVIAKQYEVGEKTLYQPLFEAWIPKPEAAWNLKPEAAKQIQEGRAVKGKRQLEEETPEGL